MKDIEQAYLAGLFDGEGSASVVHTQYEKRGRKRLYQSHKVQFIVSNEDKRVLKEVRLLFGNGRIYPEDGSFRISKPRDIIEAIHLIKPYIRVKHTDLANLRSACEFVLKVRGPGKRHKWSKGETNQFLKFVETSKALKGPGKRGRPRKHPM